MTQTQQQTILVVDDTPENIDVLAGVLRGSYKVKAAISGRKALDIASSTPRPDMVLLDIMMPEMDGYEVLSRLKSNPITAQIPVIFVTAMTEHEDEEKGLDLGAVDYITKPISPRIVLARVKTHLALYNQNRELERKVHRRTQELRESRFDVIRHLAKAAEFKDTDTGLHVVRMSHYSRIVARAINASAEWAELIFNAAPMHDVGKIGIPDSILLKPGKLTPQEWDVMKQHTIIGADILGDDPSELIQLAREIALSHHERWDGSGYPYGLAGEDIPLSGRIVAIADVFDALVSNRPYKKAWTIDQAMQLIEKDSGTHFDPRLVQAFRQNIAEVVRLKKELTEDDMELCES